MLTKDEYLNALDAHVQAGMAMAKAGRIKQAMSMLTGIISLAWELTRPTTEHYERDISGRIPDEYRELIDVLQIHVIVEKDDDGKEYALMAWGQGRNRDGNDVIDEDKLPDHAYPKVMAVIDEELKAHFGYLDMSKVSDLDEELAKSKLQKFGGLTTTHIEVTQESIDKQVAEFSEKLDSMLDNWGGSDD